MELDKNNFKDNFALIKALIDDCDFISIDTELTGLYTENTHFFDTPEVRYKHSRDYAMSYAITQFGICIFKYNSEANCVSYAPLNFHLLSQGKSEKDNFTVNVETVHFLNKNNFDFNKTFRDGLPFMRLSEYENQKSLNKLKMDHELTSLDVDNNAKDFDFGAFAKIIPECETFLKIDGNEDLRFPNDLQRFDEYLLKEHLSNRIGCINGNWIFPIFEYDKELKQKFIRITKISNCKELKRKAIVDKYDKREHSLTEQVQFSELIKYIGQTKKFLIGHNCLLDCLHMYDKFIGELPENLKEYKKVFGDLFPNFIDTKHLVFESKHLIFKNMAQHSLQSCFEATNTLAQNPVYEPYSEAHAFSGDDKFHTAHYDAFITGKLFLNLFKEIAPSVYDIPKNFVSDAPTVLKPYRNKFNFVFAELDCINMNAEFVEKNNNRKHVFHLTIPNYWQPNDVYKYLATLLEKDLKFMFEKMVRLDWINDSSLMVKMPDEIAPSKGTLSTNYSQLHFTP